MSFMLFLEQLYDLSIFVETQSNLECGTKQALQVVILGTVCMTLDVILHLQHLIEPLQYHHCCLLNCYIAIMWRILHHFHKCFIGSRS